jgi:hypothetical protein
VSLATLADLKSLLGFTQTDVPRDALLTRYLNSASLQIERYTGRNFTPNPALVSGSDTAADATLVVDARYQTRLALPDARVVTSLTLDGRTIVAGSYQLDTDPLTGTSTFIDLNPTAPLSGYPVSPVTPAGLTLSIVGRFGIWPVPDDIVDACLTIAARRYQARTASWGDAVQTPDGGVVNYFRTLPAEIQSILDGYRNLVVA